MIASENIQIDFKARYFKTGHINAQTTKVWFVLHGYAQLAAHFIKKFEVLNDSSTCIIAPEGLSKFYMNGFGLDGRVAASWMTKEDRLTDIENYLTYLNRVYEKEITDSPFQNFEVSLLGFSQGAATVCRWAQSPHIDFKRLVLWAGVFPPDLDVTTTQAKLKGKQVHFVYGTQDPYINDKALAEQQRLVNTLAITPNVITFEGKHEIAPSVLSTYFSQ